MHLVQELVVVLLQSSVLVRTVLMELPLELVVAVEEVASTDSTPVAAGMAQLDKYKSLLISKE